MNRSCRGFTLVELLVVIAIIGVLVAQLLPAVFLERYESEGPVPESGSPTEPKPEAPAENP